MLKTNNIKYKNLIDRVLRFFLSLYCGLVGAFTTIASLYTILDIKSMFIFSTISFILYGLLMWYISFSIKKGSFFPFLFALSLTIVSALLPPFFNDLNHGIGIILTK
jgi:hypothetical protein